jgi:hypothetical protein
MWAYSKIKGGGNLYICAVHYQPPWSKIIYEKLIVTVLLRKDFVPWIYFHKIIISSLPWESHPSCNLSVCWATRNQTIFLLHIYVRSLLYTRNYWKRIWDISISDVDFYVIIFKLLDSIYNALPVFLSRWEFRRTYKGSFFCGFAYTKCDASWFPEYIELNIRPYEVTGFFNHIMALG